MVGEGYATGSDSCGHTHPFLVLILSPGWFWMMVLAQPQRDRAFLRRKIPYVSSFDRGRDIAFLALYVVGKDIRSLSGPASIDQENVL